MKREGDRVYVLVNGLVVESVSGQAVLNLPDSLEVVCDFGAERGPGRLSR